MPPPGHASLLDAHLNGTWWTRAPSLIVQPAPLFSNAPAPLQSATSLQARCIFSLAASFRPCGPYDMVQALQVHDDAHKWPSRPAEPLHLADPSRTRLSRCPWLTPFAHG
eukprot:361917-Chlamydomonas_euryale.AAC.2